MPKMKDDKITIIDSDVEKIRHRPTMYIANLGEMGVLHLCKEIIDNNRDECLKPDSPGDQIDIVITDNELQAKDNGRGIPTKLLRVVHETNQAGSNMTRAHGMTAGENGTGTTAVLAMSDFLEVTTLRPQEKKMLTLRYEDSKLVSEDLKDYAGKEHGLITRYRPSRKILGYNKIPVDMLVKWIEDFKFTLPANIKMNYNVRGKQFKIEHRALNTYFDDFIPEDQRLTTALSFTTSGELRETFDDEDYQRSFSLEAAIVYSSPDYHGEDIRKSWMNMIHTSQNGSHVNGVVNGLIRYLSERVIKRNKKLEEDESLKRDILSHLHVVVNAKCDYAHMFSSQAKSTVFPRALTIAISDATYKTLCEMNQNRLTEFVEIVLQNNRVRREGERVRNVTNETKKKQWTKSDSYLPCSSVKTAQPKEIFFVEGNSASGSINAARDAKYQAILQFRGKSLNVWDLTLDEALKSNVWFEVVKVLGCGVGASFDIKKLNFDKIIIATDADVDGYHIRVGICAFFLKFMPQLFEYGKIYIAEPPLYQLSSGKQIFYVTSQTEYIETCVKSVGNIMLNFPNMQFSCKARKFISSAFEYLSRLSEVSVKLSANRYLLEQIAHGLTIWGSVDKFIDNIDSWVRDTCKIFPELGFDHKSHQVFATIDLTDQVVVIDQALFNALRYVMDVQSEYGVHVELDNRRVTLARFFEEIERKYPVIKDRYKGLGSSNADVLEEIVMNPKTRHIFQLDASDAKTMQVYDMLVGKSKDAMRARKEMMLNFEWQPSDIDT